MSPSRFRNSRSRLERARLHRKALELEWASLFEGERPTSVVRDDKRPGWWLLRLDFRPESISRIGSNQLSLELGELAYQLRSALDGLIWDAITYTQGSEPPSDAKRLSTLEFPLAPTWKVKDDKDSFNGFPFPQKLIDWLKSVQPGTADKPIDHPDCGLQNTLEDIHDLARYDRHRRLRIIGMVPLVHKLALTGTEPPGGRITDYEWLSCDPLDGKYDVVRIKVVGLAGLHPYKIDLKPHLTFTISAEDVELYGGEDIGVQLDRFIDAVRRVIDRFEEEFL